MVFTLPEGEVSSKMNSREAQGNHRRFMREAYEEAERGLREGGLPIGSVLVLDGKVIGRGHNRRIQKGSAILHAEMDCLENAGRQRTDVYGRSTLYSTLSPCDMCSGAILLYKIPTVVMGEDKNFQGPEEHLKERGVRIVNLHDRACEKMMRDFIVKNPALWYEDIGV